MESRPAPLDAHPAPPPSRPPRAVLFDRDGTLVHDVPYNRDPALVRALPGARALLDALRERGVRCAVVSNQSGVARGLITPDELAAVNARVEELLGPFDAFLHCPHGPQDGCPCRKPAPGMLLEACRRLDVAPADALMVGDIGADMEAAAAAGVQAVMVPTTVTLRQEVDAAPLVAGSLDDLGGWLLAPPAHAAAGTTAEPAPITAAGPTAGPAA